LTKNTIRYGKVPALGTKKISTSECRAPNVNLVPPNISETTTARKLKLKIQLDVVKYSLGTKKIPIRGV